MLRLLAYAFFGIGVATIIIGIRRGVDGATALTQLYLLFLITCATWIWPWYLLWPLGFAALSPPSRSVRLTLIFSASSLLIYPLFGYQGTQAWWVFNLRSLAVWVLPLILFCVYEMAMLTRRSDATAGISERLRPGRPIGIIPSHHVGLATYSAWPRGGSRCRGDRCLSVRERAQPSRRRSQRVQPRRSHLRRSQLSQRRTWTGYSCPCHSNSPRTVDSSSSR